MKEIARIVEGLVMLMVLSAMAVMPSISFACSCWHPSPQQLLEAPRVIFLGTVTEIDQKASVAKFRVLKVYKGVVVGDEVPIHFDSGPGASCGISFDQGATHTVFADLRRIEQGNEIFSTGLCSMIPYLSSPMTFQPALDAYAITVERARRVAELYPDSATAWDALSRIHENNKDYLAALVSLQRLQSTSEGNSEPYVRMGNALLAVERYEQALTSFSSALEILPSLVAAKKGRNQALLKLGRTAELDLTVANFSGMEVPISDFAERVLAGVDFSKTRMSRPAFQKADLTGSNFSGGSVYQGNFKDAKMAGVQFDNASTYACDFSNADLESAKFNGADIREGNFQSANLRWAIFAKARAEKANFSHAVVKSANFKNAFLYGADFSSVDLSGHDLSGLEMQGARFVNAQLANTNLSNAMFAGPVAAFRDNEALHGPGYAADFRGADLTGAKLNGADLRYAMFDCKTRWPEGFQVSAQLLFPVSSRDCPNVSKTALFIKPGVLREMPGVIGGERSTVRGPQFKDQNFQEIDLSGANLSGFQFSNVNFDHAKLIGTDFRNANLQNSDFSNADLSGADLGGARLDAATYNSATVWPSGFDPATVGAKLK